MREKKKQKIRQLEAILRLTKVAMAKPYGSNLKMQFDRLKIELKKLKGKK